MPILMRMPAAPSEVGPSTSPGPRGSLGLGADAYASPHAILGVDGVPGVAAPPCRGDR